MATISGIKLGERKLAQSLRKQQQILEDAARAKALLDNSTRARSITVGTCFGGTVEVSMRGDGINYLWVPMHQPEVIELIHQLAASVGCHIHIKPREDFSSFRHWEPTGQVLLPHNQTTEPARITEQVSSDTLMQGNNQKEQSVKVTNKRKNKE